MSSYEPHWQLRILSCDPLIWINKRFARAPWEALSSEVYLMLDPILGA
jgi:hypothetical protein